MPSGLRRYLYRVNLDEAYEIHMRLGKPFLIYYSDGCYFLNPEGVLTLSPKGAVRVTRAHIDEAIELASASSLYTKKDSLCQGFITIDGGYRIGVCGTGVIKNGQVEFIRDISSLNYRLRCEYIGCAEKLFEYVENSVKNILIISPPAAGKTTMLRDLSRILSHRGHRICIVDERSELAAVNEGISPFDLGYFTDVLDGIKKSTGMLMALRAMSPEIIVTDEIGEADDVKAIESIINSGVKIITSVHGFNIAQVSNRKEMKECLKFFDVFCTLSRRGGAGTIESIINREDAECLK